MNADRHASRTLQARNLGFAILAILVLVGGCDRTRVLAADNCHGLDGRVEAGINVNQLYTLPPAKLSDSIRTLQDLGVGWARFDLDWKRVQPDPDGPLQLEGYDRLVEALGKAQIKSLVVIYDAPSWANGGHPEFYPPDPDLFAAFAGKVAAHYKHRVAAWQIWNEPNVERFWKPAPEPQAYARLLRSAARRIHASDPAALVVSAGLSQVGEGPGRVPAAAFADAVYREIGNRDFDAVGNHPYTSPGLPVLRGSNNWARNWWAPGGMREVMSRFGDAGKPIWATEFGAATFGDDPSVRVSEGRQARILRTAFANLPPTGTGPLFWYNLRDFCSYAPGRSTECYYGLQRSDGSAKPAYHALKRVTACLRGGRAPARSGGAF